MVYVWTKPQSFIDLPVRGFGSQPSKGLSVGSATIRAIRCLCRSHFSRWYAWHPWARAWAFEIHAEANVDKFSVRDITPPLNMELSRIDRRKSILSAIDQMQRKADMQPSAYDALDQHYRAAFNMITAPETKRAFDIGSESASLRDQYGRTPFGQRLLLSRRLIESGVRFVTVSDPGWDNHQDCFNALKIHRMPQVDQALPQLLIDLEERGLLASTLVFG